MSIVDEVHNPPETRLPLRPPPDVASRSVWLSRPKSARLNPAGTEPLKSSVITSPLASRQVEPDGHRCTVLIEAPFVRSCSNSDHPVDTRWTMTTIASPGLTPVKVPPGFGNIW